MDAGVKWLNGHKARPLFIVQWTVLTSSPGHVRYRLSLLGKASSPKEWTFLRSAAALIVWLTGQSINYVLFVWSVGWLAGQEEEKGIGGMNCTSVNKAESADRYRGQMTSFLWSFHLRSNSDPLQRCVQAKSEPFKGSLNNCLL